MLDNCKWEMWVEDGLTLGSGLCQTSGCYTLLRTNNNQGLPVEEVDVKISIFVL